MRHVENRKAWPGIRMRLVDLVSLFAAWATSFVLTNITTPGTRMTSHSWILVGIAVVATMVMFERAALYQMCPTLPRTDEISRLLGGILAGAAIAVVVVAFLDWRIGAWEILVGVFTSASVLILARGMIRRLGAELSPHNHLEPVIIVGSGKEAGELAEVILDHPESRFRLVGLVGHLPVAEKYQLEHLWLGPTSRLVELMHVHQTRSAIVTPTGFRGEQFRSITSVLFDAGFDVNLSTGVSRLWDGRFEVRSLAHEPIVVMSANEPPAWQRAIKRIIDVIGAIVALIIVSPVLILTAMAIKVEDGGPILFKQPRAGRRSQFFEMIKFRSMVPDAEELKSELEGENERSGPLFKVDNDPRITKVGRFIRETSIDELPQLINVLRGQMSLVGPRPALIEEEQAFDDEHRARFDVRPGITGLWQVEARRNSSFSAYRRLDLHYVENWTLGLDLRILLATVEQLIVSGAVLPLRRFFPNSMTEQAAPTASSTVIDLRERTTARLVAEHGSGSRVEPTPRIESSNSAPIDR